MVGQFLFPFPPADGILIGTLKGQITVVTAKEAPSEKDNEIGPGDPANAIPTIAATAGGGRGPLKAVKLPVDQQPVDACAYNQKHESVFLVGLTEIDVGLASNTDDKEPKPEFHVFNMVGVVLNIRKSGNAIEVVSKYGSKCLSTLAFRG